MKRCCAPVDFVANLKNGVAEIQPKVGTLGQFTTHLSRGCGNDPISSFLIWFLLIPPQFY
jgi:hypothetical protein